MIVAFWVVEIFLGFEGGDSHDMLHLQAPLPPAFLTMWCFRFSYIYDIAILAFFHLLPPKRLFSWNSAPNSTNRYLQIPTAPENRRTLFYYLMRLDYFFLKETIKVSTVYASQAGGLLEKKIIKKKLQVCSGGLILNFALFIKLAGQKNILAQVHRKWVCSANSCVQFSPNYLGHVCRLCIYLRPSRFREF